MCFRETPIYFTLVLILYFFFTILETRKLANRSDGTWNLSYFNIICCCTNKFRPSKFSQPFIFSFWELGDQTRSVYKQLFIRFNKFGQFCSIVIFFTERVCIVSVYQDFSPEPVAPTVKEFCYRSIDIYLLV